MNRRDIDAQLAELEADFISRQAQRCEHMSYALFKIWRFLLRLGAPKDLLRKLRLAADALDEAANFLRAKAIYVRANGPILARVPVRASPSCPSP